MWFSRRVKSCVIRPLLFTAPFRVTPRQDLPGAVWRALLGSWTIHVFADHVVVLQTRAKSRWCWIRDAVTQEYFGACSCGWVGLVGGPPGSKAGLGWGGGGEKRRQRNDADTVKTDTVLNTSCLLLGRPLLHRCLYPVWQRCDNTWCNSIDTNR